MGIVLAKFRKEKTTAEVLETLEERIQQIENYSFNTQEQKKRFVGNFLAISIGVYVVAFLVFYFVYFPPTWKERIIYSVPLFLFPFVIILLRMLFTWYFQRKLNKNSSKLKDLRAEKKKILEQVMDKETYKVAVSLLARFGDKSTKSMIAMTPKAPSATPARPNIATRALTTNASNQLNSSMRTLNTSLAATPRQTQLPSSSGGLSSSTMSSQLVSSPQIRSGQELRRRTPFPIVNQNDKGVFERIVDVLIGDGPQDRFAMICKECFAHNGMALKEEFDFATFRCAFCSALNPSRKARPVAPPLQIAGTPRRKPARDSSASSSSSSDDEDSDKENVQHKVPHIHMTGASSPETTNTTEDAAKPDDYADDEEENQQNEKENVDSNIAEDSKPNDGHKKEM